MFTARAATNRVVIAETYPLGQAARAVTRMLEHHPSGKIAITV